MSQNLWFPTINADKCNSCKGAFKCVNFCPHKVLKVKKDKAFVVNPLCCIYGCSVCARLCPRGAIIFPKREGSHRTFKKASFLHKVTCPNCEKKFLTDRETLYCFDCEE